LSPLTARAAPDRPSAASERNTAPVLEYADLTLDYAAGRVKVSESKRGRFAHPTALERFRGRFEARAIRRTGSSKQQVEHVLERVRFDFPLLADAETDDASQEARELADRLRAGVVSHTQVRVPLPDGTDAVAVVDTKTSVITYVELKRGR
jgi:hypothetical protein